MKRKILLSPLIIAIIVIIFGVTAAGAAILLGGGGGNTTDVNLQKGLVGWWKFDGDAKDSTPQGNNGTVTGATLTTDRKGQTNKAYNFVSASSQYIDAGTKAIFNLSSTLTISAWVYKSGTAWQYYFGKGYFGTGELSIGYHNTCSSWFLAYDVSSICFGSDLRDQWAHVVVTYDSSLGSANFKTYENGVAKQTANFTGDAMGASFALNIGVSSGDSRYWQGNIDDVRVYNRALSATEITALYQEYNPGIQVSDLQKGLVGQWKFDGDAKDMTPNGNGCTVTGATLTTDRKAQVDKAYNFDGVNDFLGCGTSSKMDLTNVGTVAAWVYITAYPGAGKYPGIISKGSQYGWDTAGYAIWINGDSGGAVKALIVNPSPTRNEISWGNLATGTWWHLVFTWDGSNLNVYKNGASAATPVAQTLNADSSTRAFEIGRANAATHYANVITDDVRIYNRALSATEITALYQEYDPGIQVSNLQKGLVGQWSFDGDAKDRTPYGNNGASDTGGTITYSGGYTIHTFTSSGTFTTYGSKNVEVLVVGGGGGGGTSGGRGGGGGAGGYRYNSSFAVTQQAYSVTVGNGGDAGVWTGDPGTSTDSKQGQDSVFSTITATGGGRGGGAGAGTGFSSNGGNGGSGGGGEANMVSTGGTGNTPSTSPSQGSNGGAGGTGGYGAGGGGGASAVGAAGSGSNGGNGGDGTANSISGASVTYAGGGGGGSSGGTDGAGGAGGGGKGGTAQSAAVAGTANTGGGGGGAGASNAKAGGSGIVIIRYPTLNAIADRKGQTARAYSFNGTSDYVYVGNAGSGIKTVSFWMQADDTTTRKIIDIDGTDQIELDASSNITATSFPGTTTIYVDGAVASNIADTNWHFVTITDTTGVSASGFNIGAVATSYFDGKLDDVRVYNRALSATEITALYESY